MILPNKYIAPTQSIFYLGAVVLKIIKNDSVSIVNLWINFKKIQIIQFHMQNSYKL